MTDTVKVQGNRESLIAPEGVDARHQNEALVGPADGKSPEKVATVSYVSSSSANGTFDIEALVGYILLVGVLTSMALIMSGLVWHWLRTGEIGFRYSISGMNFFEFLLKGLGQVFADQYRPRVLVSLGIAMLMLTPFVRVLASMLYFLFAARNWKYAVFTAFVLTILTYSLFLR